MSRLFVFWQRWKWCLQIVTRRCELINLDSTTQFIYTLLVNPKIFKIWNIWLYPPNYVIIMTLLCVWDKLSCSHDSKMHRESAEIRTEIKIRDDRVWGKCAVYVCIHLTGQKLACWVRMTRVVKNIFLIHHVSVFGSVLIMHVHMVMTMKYNFSIRTRSEVILKKMRSIFFSDLVWAHLNLGCNKIARNSCFRWWVGTVSVDLHSTQEVLVCSRPYTLYMKYINIYKQIILLIVGTSLKRCVWQRFSNDAISFWLRC